MRKIKHIFFILVSALLTIFLFATLNPIAAQIRGKVIDADGYPVKELLVELVSHDLPANPARNEILDDVTDEQGLFEFEDTPPGRYVLAIGYVWTPNIDDPYPTTFYPNARTKSGAVIFEIANNQKPQDIIFQLPEKLPTLNVQGKIFGANGKPAVNAHVRLHHVQSTLVVSDCRTDDNGNFFLKGFVGGRYRIEADNYGMLLEVWDTAASEIFALNRNMKGFRLTLKSINK